MKTDDELATLVPDIKRVEWPSCDFEPGEPGQVYDATEVSLCIEYDSLDGLGGTFVETVDRRTGDADVVQSAREIFKNPPSGSAPIRSFWTVYGHRPEGGVAALADGTHETVSRLAAALEYTIQAQRPFRVLSCDAIRQRRALLDRLAAIALDPH